MLIMAFPSRDTAQDPRTVIPTWHVPVPYFYQIAIIASRDGDRSPVSLIPRVLLGKQTRNTISFYTARL